MPNECQPSGNIVAQEALGRLYIFSSISFGDFGTKSLSIFIEEVRSEKRFGHEQHRKHFGTLNNCGRLRQSLGFSGTVLVA